MFVQLSSLPAVLSQTEQAAQSWYEQAAACPSFPFSQLDPARTALFVVDMVGGFAREGALSSSRVGALIDPIATLAGRCEAAGIPVVAFADTHTPDSLELTAYPAHCLAGTEEAAVCPEIRQASPSLLTIEKNSTNGFVEPAFSAWLEAHPERDVYVVCGDCTDICVLQFVLTAKAWHNTRNHPLDILLPLELIDTFDAPGHPAEPLSLFSLSLMHSAGATLCSTVLLDP